MMKKTNTDTTPIPYGDYTQCLRVLVRRLRHTFRTTLGTPAESDDCVWRQRLVEVTAERDAARRMYDELLHLMTEQRAGEQAAQQQRAEEAAAAVKESRLALERALVSQAAAEEEHLARAEQLRQKTLEMVRITRERDDLLRVMKTVNMDVAAARAEAHAQQEAAGVTREVWRREKRSDPPMRRKD